MVCHFYGFAFLRRVTLMAGMLVDPALAFCGFPSPAANYNR